ncbi:MAG: PDZ domain-containing protein [Deltaproteobacteria bacterium]|nr:PDZ domain-containing protein [Candidatus Tharpella aukensis]
MKRKSFLNIEWLLAILVIILFVGGFFYVFHEPETATSVSLSKEQKDSSSKTVKDVPPEPAVQLPTTVVAKKSKPVKAEKNVTEKVKSVAETVSPEADFGVSGAVFAFESGLPLAGCQVSFNGQSQESNQAGEFYLWADGGISRLSFSCAGFKSLAIAKFDIQAGSGLARFDVYLSEVEKSGDGRIEVNGVSGRVYDRESGAPLAAARIVISSVRTVTDDAGFFELWGNSSSLVTMLVSAPGYVREMISGIDFENQSNPFFFEVLLERAQVGKGRMALVGIGARLVKSEEGYEIADLLDDSPALNEGLAPGDRLVAVDSLAVDDFSLREVVELIRGQAGQPVTLMVERDGDFLEFICLRERVLY